MKKFVLLQTRPEDAPADNEYEAFLKFSDLKPSMLERFRVHEGVFPNIDLNEYSGILIGGGPYCISDPEFKKSDNQKRYELAFSKLLDQVIPADFPLLATCGIGPIIKHLGGKVSKEYGESLDSINMNLTESGKYDPLLNSLASSFDAFCGHKEACEVLPPNDAEILAYSTSCPFQIVRIKNNIYLVQFHSELDANGLAVRIQAYKNHGYFRPEEADSLIAEAKNHNITEPVKILKNFVELYKK